MKAFCRLMAVAFVFVALSALVHGRVDKSDSKVKITAEASEPDADGKQTVTLHMNVLKGWHVYANPVRNEDFINAQTVVSLKGGAPLKAVKIEYPAGKVHKDKTVGDFNIYEDKVVIKAHIVRSPGDTSPLQVTVDIQACDENNCLLPGKVTLTVK